MSDDFCVEFVLVLELGRRLLRASCQLRVVSCSESSPLTYFFHAALWGSGMLASTLFISDGPKPVTVRLCLGRVMPAGPMGPLKSVMGADELGRRSRAGRSVTTFVSAMLGAYNTTPSMGDDVDVTVRRKNSAVR